MFASVLSIPLSRPRASRQQSWVFVALGGLAGLLAGVDAILLTFLHAMLSGSESDDLVVGGVGHAGWNAANGVQVGVAPGGLAILLGAIVLGAATGWLVHRRPRRAR